MEEWHYDPANEDVGLAGRLERVGGDPGLLVGSVRTVSAVAVRSWLRVYHRFTITGRQHLPLGASFILIANHASHLDALCLLAALPLPRLHAAFPVAAQDYFCVSAVRRLVARVIVNALPFDRCFPSCESLNACARLLDRPGTILIVFPEGTRSGGGEPGEFKAGVGLLAAGRAIPIVPCHLAGTHAGLPKGAWWPRPRRVRLTIGRPRLYAHLPPTRETAKRISRELREAVVSLGRIHNPALAAPATAACWTPGERSDALLPREVS